MSATSGSVRKAKTKEELAQLRKMMMKSKFRQGSNNRNPDTCNQFPSSSNILMSERANLNNDKLLNTPVNFAVTFSQTDQTTTSK